MEECVAIYTAQSGRQCAGMIAKYPDRHTKIVKRWGSSLALLNGTTESTLLRSWMLTRLLTPSSQASFQQFNCGTTWHNWHNWHHLAQLTAYLKANVFDTGRVWRAFMNTFSAKIFKRNKGIDLSIWPKKAWCRSMILWWCKLKVMIWIQHCCWKWVKATLKSFHSSSAFSDFRTLLLFLTKVCSRVLAVKH